MPVLEKSEGFLHEEGVFLPGIITNIEEDEGKFGPQLKLILSIEGDDDDNETWAFCSQTYSEGSKLGGWVMAILGNMPEPLDTDDLLDRPVQVMFERFNRINPKSGATEEREKVVKIRAYSA
jgi:hypothetical protein